MYLCDLCKKKKVIRRVMGDGSCKKHGRFGFWELGLKELCPGCAKEKRICQRCGVYIPIDLIVEPANPDAFLDHMIKGCPPAVLEDK